MRAVGTLLWISTWSIITRGGECSVQKESDAGFRIMSSCSKLHQFSSTCLGDSSVPKAENVHWVSLDFKTILNWRVKHSDYKYTVWYSVKDGEWTESPDCSRTSQSGCDLTMHLFPYIDRFYEADVKTEHPSQDQDYNYDTEELPHTVSPLFNPYRESNISAVEFSLVEVNQTTVIINITDPITSIHHQGKQYTIRDVLEDNLKYKILYYKSGSTRERDIVSDSSTATVSELDAGQSYCFMVAAFIPSRPKAKQLGAWSAQLCKQGDTHLLQDLSLGAWVGIVFISLIVTIIIITVTVLCCRSRHQRNKSLQTSQSSAPI